MKQRSLFIHRHPLLCWFTALLLCPLALLLWFGVNYLVDTLPQTDGERIVPNVKAAVSLTRDANGVLYIKASSDHDAFFAMGYAQAQDRLWQLTLLQRMTQGRLSEVFGEAALSFDTYVRTLGISHAASSSLAALDQASRDSLEAYASGINSYLAEEHKLPIEFTLLNVKPERWQAADSVGWVKLFSLNMANNFQEELAHVLMSQVLQPNAVALLSNTPAAEQYSGNQPTSPVALAQLLQFSAKLANDWQFGSNVIGSNAWAVAGKLNADGATVLANDPHLGLEIPSLWYAAQVKGQHIDVAGMSLVGLPVILVGKNNRISWGVTNMMADTQDLFYLQINPTNPAQYWLDGQWVDFTFRQENITVKAPFPAMLRKELAPVRLKIRETVFGPVVSDMVQSTEQPMALSWTGANPHDPSYQSFFQLNYASSWTEFQQALTLLVAPAINVVYADQQQNIGIQAAGKIPVRSTGIGARPLAGTSRQLQWQTYIPDDQLPSSFNPPSGFVVNANNQMIDADYPYFLSKDWADPARANRITELLQQAITEGRLLTLADHQRIQFDQHDGEIQPLLAVVQQSELISPEAQQLVSFLMNWDGAANADSVAATIFFTFADQLRRELLADEFTAAWNRQSLQQALNTVLQELTVPRLTQAITDQNIPWCDDLRTAEVENCDQIVDRSLRKTHQVLSKLLGPAPETWHWKEAHQLLLAHRPFSDMRGLDAIFERRHSSAGSPGSVNVSGFNFNPDDGFTQQYGAGFRQIICWVHCAADYQFVNSTGQSGNVVSPHYDDMSKAFISGQYFQMALPSTESRHHLVLQPQPVEQ